MSSRPRVCLTGLLFFCHRLHCFPLSWKFEQRQFLPINLHPSSIFSWDVSRKWGFNSSHLSADTSFGCLHLGQLPWPEDTMQWHKTSIIQIPSNVHAQDFHKSCSRFLPGPADQTVVLPQKRSLPAAGIFLIHLCISCQTRNCSKVESLGS